MWCLSFCPGLWRLQRSVSVWVCVFFSDRCLGRERGPKNTPRRRRPPRFLSLWDVFREQPAGTHQHGVVLSSQPLWLFSWPHRLRWQIVCLGGGFVWVNILFAERTFHSAKVFWQRCYRSSDFLFFYFLHFLSFSLLKPMFIHKHTVYTVLIYTMLYKFMSDYIHTVQHHNISLYH